MVQVTLRLRPKNGYHTTNKIKTFTLDSSSRLEELLIVSGENGGGGNGGSTSASKSSSLYSSFGQELALNTSIASHNFENNELIETCKSPNMSAALTSVLKDIEEVKCQIISLGNNEMEIKELLHQKLQFAPEKIAVDSYWDVQQWNHDRLKNRTICLATMKKVLQRDDRFQVFDIPYCQTIQDLHEHITPTWDEMRNHDIPISDSNSTASGSISSGSTSRTRVAPNMMKYLLSPKTKRNGLPSTLWILIERKIEIQNQIKSELLSRGSTVDPLEEFIRRDDLRHPTDNNTRAPTSRRRRNQNIEEQNGNNNTESNAATTTTARNNSSSRRNKHYSPDYSSGPFAILATLYEAMDPTASDDPNVRQQRRELSLTETKLKHKAQQRCRSNLYDRGIGRGNRSAFACMETLAGKEFVRKETGNFNNDANVAKWSLIPKGERLGRDCLEFQKAVNQVFPTSFGQDSGVPQRQIANKDDIKLIVDNREDSLFRERLKFHCSEDNVPFEERELPAGDYLFTKDDRVIPLIIERKSWSDLADSVMGKGKASRRLDCVNIKNISLGRSFESIEEQIATWRLEPHCRTQNCQLCKMKRSGCSQILFIIEGIWCAGRDDAGNRNKNKCTQEKPCQTCRALMDRHHGVTDEMLQKVLNRMQVQHGCHVHFTNSYNETITSLFMIRKLLMEGDTYAASAFERTTAEDNTNKDDLQRAVALSLNENDPKTKTSLLTYDEFSSNVRKSKSRSQYSFERKKKDVVHMSVQSFVQSIIEDEAKWRHSVCKSIFNENVKLMSENLGNEETQAPNHHVLPQQQDKNTSDTRDVINILEEEQNNIVDLNETDDSIEVIEVEESQDSSIIEILDNSQGSMINIEDGDNESASSDSTIDLVSTVNDSNDNSNRLGESKPNRSESTSDLKKATEALNDTPLLVLQQMQLYNDRFMKDINNVWKEVFGKKMMDVQNDGENTTTNTNIDILTRSIQGLQNLQLSDTFPYLRREAFLFVTLFLQIKLGVMLRIASRNAYASEMRQLWDYSSRHDSFDRPTEVAPFTENNATQSFNAATTSSLRRQNNSTPTTQGGIERHSSTQSNNCTPTSSRRQTTARQSQPSNSTPANNGASSRPKRSNESLVEPNTNNSTNLTTSSSSARRTKTVPTKNHNARINKSVDRSTSMTRNERDSNAPDRSRRNMSAQRADAIKARLRRFESEKPKESTQKSSSTSSRLESSQQTIQAVPVAASNQEIDSWACGGCTLLNSPELPSCKICNTLRPPLPWNCKHCTLENPPDVLKCDACGNERFEDKKPNNVPSISTSYQGFEPNSQDYVSKNPPYQGFESENNPQTSNPVSHHNNSTYSSSSTSTSRNIPKVRMVQALSLDHEFQQSTQNGNICSAVSDDNKKTSSKSKSSYIRRCGACGEVGHYRANATPENCDAYYGDAEVKRRQEKQDKIEAKAARAEQELREQEASNRTYDDLSTTRTRQIEKLLEEQKKENELNTQLREAELKRKRKAAERARKQAEKRRRL